MRHRLSVSLLAAAVVAGAGACSGDSSGAIPADLPGERVAQGLCEAAAATDFEGAEESFAAVHDGLHDTARALQEVDRSAAARLLEAKQVVEADLQRQAPISELGPKLDRLVTATLAGLDRLDVAGSCEG